MSLDVVVKNKKSEFVMGMMDAMPIGLGYGPVAMAYGLLAKSAGLTLIQSVAMSLIVFAGASQFMALNLIAVGVGIGEVILATFLINLRHLLMSMSISEKLLSLNRGVRAALAFGVTDESFAVASIKGGKLSTGYMAGLELFSYGFWVVGSGFGYLVGTVLPPMLQTSMGIALYAMFIGLLIPSAKKSKKVLLLAVLAASLNGVFSLFLTGGWPMIAATIVASLGVALILPEGGA